MWDLYFRNFGKQVLISPFYGWLMSLFVSTLFGCVTRVFIQTVSFPSFHNIIHRFSFWVRFHLNLNFSLKLGRGRFFYWLLLLCSTIYTTGCHCSTVTAFYSTLEDKLITKFSFGFSILNAMWLRNGSSTPGYGFLNKLPASNQITARSFTFTDCLSISRTVEFPSTWLSTIFLIKLFLVCF